MVTSSSLMHLLTLYWALCSAVSAIRCYYCDNAASPACGMNFKAYQFTAEECLDYPSKCGKQEQPPSEAEGGWIGVVRTCYQLGSIPGMNETNGCHNYTTPENFTALYCFCDTDYCNFVSNLVGSVFLMTVAFFATSALRNIMVC